jgi:hypothetical protein
MPVIELIGDIAARVAAAITGAHVGCPHSSKQDLRHHALIFVA